MIIFIIHEYEIFFKTTEFLMLNYYRGNSDTSSSSYFYETDR